MAGESPAGGTPTGDRAPLAGAPGPAAAAEFEALYRQHYPRLVRSLRLAGIGGEAEDVAQEAFARTLVHWWRVRRGTNPAGYAYRVAFRLAFRRRRRAVALVQADGSVPDAIAAATLRVDVERRLAAMPAGRRRCAVLVLLVGLEPAEVARALRIAPSTVRKQVSLARADLAQADRAQADRAQADRARAEGRGDEQPASAR